MRRNIITIVLTFVIGFALGFLYHGIWTNMEIKARLDSQPVFPAGEDGADPAGQTDNVLSSEDASENSEGEGYGLFSWNDWVPGEEEADTLKQCVLQTGVTEIYQDFTDENYRSGQAEDFTGRLSEMGVSVYSLLGDAEWSYEENARTLVNEMAAAVRYNQKQTEEKRIKGFMIDVEPYLLDEWADNENTRMNLMLKYLKCMKIGCTYAHEHQMEFLVCIPTFFDDDCPEILSQLVSDACDGIAVMNYDRRDEYGQIETEVELARQYGRRIICIYELQDVGLHGLEDVHTYANAGLDALWQSAEDLDSRFDYDKLQFAYHYYLPLKNMLEKR